MASILLSWRMSSIKSCSRTWNSSVLFIRRNFERLSWHHMRQRLVLWSLSASSTLWHTRKISVSTSSWWDKTATWEHTSFWSHSQAFPCKRTGPGNGANTPTYLALFPVFSFHYRNSSVSQVLCVYSIFGLTSAFVTCGKFSLVEVLYCFAPY